MSGVWLLCSALVVHLTRSEDFAAYNAYNPRSGSATTPPKSNPNKFDDVFPEKTPASSSQRAAYASASNCFKTGGGLVPEYYICRGPGDLMGHDEQYYCQSDEAAHCLEDLRQNRSRNVHPWCNYTVNKVVCTASDDFGQAGPITAGESRNRTGHCGLKRMEKSGMQLLATVREDNTEKWRGCCPMMGDAASETTFAASSAYPDALLCLKRANCEREQVYKDLVAECSERCCAGGTCRYAADHPDRSLAGKLLPAFEGLTRFTEGGPCSPTVPSAAAGLARPGVLGLLAALGAAVALAL